ncbi:DUF4870 domain-containing protein [Fictibacillus aquaticus]|uniref:DUF4870 domain-containing protein n=1 Tax=Fictibacillus aquaticus TaxID=2021314 RepID=A0A235F8E4_9BACL|nr:DUF4870 domain-containing protein [Fictibacillus aquaticus]OYD56955.1 hypothetical protein CGZ90_14695 [Fictibacillus aquaticus]
MNDNKNKILSSLCYFSIFFAPFLFPVVVYFVIEDETVTEHARKGFWSHLIPVIAISLGIIVVFESGFAKGAIIFSALVFGLVSLIVTIWNIVKGIKVLIQT